MIDLQNEEIKMSQGEHTNDAIFRNPGRGDPPATTVASETNADSSLGGKSLSRSARLSSLHDLNNVRTEELPGEVASVDVLEQPKTPDIFQTGEPGVGRGTLYFNTEKIGSAATSQTTQLSCPVSAEDRRLLMSTPIVYESHGGAYGSGEVPSLPPPPPGSSPLPVHPHHNNYPGQYQGRPANNQYHDSNPQYSEQYTPTRNDGGGYEQSACDSILETIKMLGSCLRKLLCAILCCCATDVEQLQRSFCFGAIDGMLTGSGIVAAFCGMNILAPTSTFTIRSFVVAFSAAACFADSLCMALGHVWTTHVLVSAHARERTTTRVSVDKNKADAKGKLVDMLLERGMLKIDAMSLVDTLEGYPDMFVSALVGEALIAGGVGGTADSSTDLSARHRSMSPGRISPSASRGWSGHHWNGGDDYSQHMAEHESGGNGNFLLWKFPSYGQHMDELEQEIDPEGAVVRAAMVESRREGLFMMIGFSIFAIVPSLLYLVCPLVVNTQQHIQSSGHGEKELDVDVAASGGSTSATSIAVTVGAAIMWCLGVWKSRFMDSNYLIFGIETVVVQLVCIAAAFGVGTIIRACFPDLDSIINGATATDVPVSR